MKIATYNVNGVNGRLPRILDWLAQTNPFIVCLQELKTEDTKFPALAFERAGHGGVWHGQRSQRGATLPKDPAAIASGMIPTPQTQNLARATTCRDKIGFHR
ncbi:MAG: endonuclease/exonuclease/phosphatase family protein [Burkholderiaceae bacterium]|nr:endonuclease/exonuclease/phosphatase family protein [Burkholderiaceae bacterium]